MRISALVKDAPDFTDERRHLRGELRILFGCHQLLWHGNQHRAGREMRNLREDVESLEVNYQHLKRFARAVHEFAVYIGNNS